MAPRFPKAARFGHQVTKALNINFDVEHALGCMESPYQMIEVIWFFRLGGRQLPGR
jgi:hypothetical protein